MLIDSHAHLIDEKVADIAMAIKEAREWGVEKIITPTTSIHEFDKAIEVAKNHKEVSVLLGVHPENWEEEGVVKAMKERVTEKKVVGIGEIGMDFYYDKERKTIKKQRETFKDQLELALELDLPVAIHCREAMEETREVLESLSRMPRGQFHCFAGDESFLDWVLENGFYVSFAGNVTFKSADDLRKLMMKTPLERLLLETDTPYLSPEPIRGRVNSPKNVKIIAEFVAKMRGVSIEELSSTTSYNTKCLYSLDV